MGAMKAFSGNALSTMSRKARTLAPISRRELCNAQISTGGPASVPQQASLHPHRIQIAFRTWRNWRNLL